MTVFASGVRIRFTDHAVARYRQRVRPGLGHPAAACQLAGLVAHARVMPRPPHWLVAAGCRQADLHLVVGDVAFPLVRDHLDSGLLWAMTTLVRGGISEHARERRNASRRARHRRGRERRTTRYLRVAAKLAPLQTDYRSRHPCRTVRSAEVRRAPREPGQAAH
jgi:hypothetical protein